MYIRLAGRGQQRQKLYLTLDGGKRREETARAAAEVEVEEVAVGWWQMEDGSWWRATRKTQFHFSFRKRQAKYKCKGKAKKRTKTWAQQREIRDLSIAVQLMSCVCVCVNSSENRQRCELKYVFFFVQMKTNLCATCSQRPFGVSSAQPDFPAPLLTWHKRGVAEGGSLGVGCSADDLNSRHGRRLI